MFLNILTKIFCLNLLSLSFVSICFAQQPEHINLSDNKEVVTIFSVAESIEQLNMLASHSPELATKQLQVSNFNQNQLNVAEQYILLMVQAKLAMAKKQHAFALNYFNNMEVLVTKLSVLQLQTESFNEAFLLLSQVHAENGDFEQAYNSKQTYLENYFNNITHLKKHALETLRLKYETNHKTKETELLQKRNELTEQKILEANQAKIVYQREQVILVLLSLVFISMLLRQFFLSKELRTLAQKDNLTGLLNRRNVFRRGQALVKNYTEHQQVFCLVMLDIDNFKSINDTYGHDVGDLVIKKVAQIGKELMRSRDIFARIGGEEFIAIFPGTNLLESEQISERFRQKLSQTSFESYGIKKPVTASFGLACVTLPIVDFEALLNAADQAMYQAKENGRNQVMIYTP